MPIESGRMVLKMKNEEDAQELMNIVMPVLNSKEFEFKNYRLNDGYGSKWRTV